MIALKNKVMCPSLDRQRCQADIPRVFARARPLGSCNLKDARTMMRTLIVVALVAAAGGAQAKSKDQKLCADLADFRASVTKLQQMVMEIDR